MNKTAFKLNREDDGWPPFDVEWLWLEERGPHFTVMNVPFFVSGLASGDQIDLSETDLDGKVTKWTMVAPGNRSVIWIADIGGSELGELLRQFRAIGCNTETIKEYSYAAVDIPSEVSRRQVDEIIEQISVDDYAISFPCDRQK